MVGKIDGMKLWSLEVNDARIPTVQHSFSPTLVLYMSPSVTDQYSDLAVDYQININHRRRAASFV